MMGLKLNHVSNRSPWTLADMVTTPSASNAGSHTYTGPHYKITRIYNYNDPTCIRGSEHFKYEETRQMARGDFNP